MHVEHGTMMATGFEVQQLRTIRLKERLLLAFRFAFNAWGRA